MERVREENALLVDESAVQVRTTVGNIFVVWRGEHPISTTVRSIVVKFEFAIWNLQGFRE